MGNNLPVYVFDSYALLAYLGGEAGMVRVQDILTESAQGKCTIMLSLINLGEVLYITERGHGIPKAQTVLAAVEQLPIQIMPATRDAVFSAAHIKANHTVSFADAFAVAAAQEQGGTILTGDPEFEAVHEMVQVEWLPKAGGKYGDPPSGR